MTAEQRELIKLEYQLIKLEYQLIKLDFEDIKRTYSNIDSITIKFKDQKNT